MYVYAHTQRTDLDVSACPSTDLMFSGLLRKVISAEVETCRAFASSPDPPATRRSRSAPFPWTLALTRWSIGSIWLPFGSVSSLDFCRRMSEMWREINDDECVVVTSVFLCVSPSAVCTVERRDRKRHRERQGETETERERETKTRHACQTSVLTVSNCDHLVVSSIALSQSLSVSLSLSLPR